jgi:hypothetical protein
MSSVRLDLEVRKLNTNVKQEKCKRILVCGHECGSECARACPPCERPCETRCHHSVCAHTAAAIGQEKSGKKSNPGGGRKCGQLCPPCAMPCVWQCEHHACLLTCAEPCARPPCTQPCRRRLACSTDTTEHYCIGVCGEPCPEYTKNKTKTTKRVTKVICSICDTEVVKKIKQCSEWMGFGYEDEPGAMFVQVGWKSGNVKMANSSCKNASTSLR